MNNPTYKVIVPDENGKVTVRNNNLLLCFVLSLLLLLLLC